MTTSTRRTPVTQAVISERGAQHFMLTGTWNVDARMACWCGKSHTLSTLGWRVMFRKLNAWLAEHESCEANT